MRICRLSIIVFLVVTRSALSQDLSSISPKDVRESLEYLASDAMGGRDTPSPQLEMAADWIAGRFARAGLVPVAELSGEDGFFHHYLLPAVRLDPTKMSIVLHGPDGSVELKGNKDFRLYGNSGAYKGIGVEFSVLNASTAQSQGLWQGRRLQKPLFLGVDEDSPLWKSCKGPRMVLQRGRGRRRSRGQTPPTVLVRQECIPDSVLKADIHVPEPEAVKASLRNVVGMIPGSTRPGEFVVFSSHYDHVGTGIPRNGDFIYNGADDDATGTTAVVLLAEAFAKREKKLPRSLLFVCFSGEEKGLLGSRALADSPPWPLEKTVANINIEMIGRPEEGKQRCAWITGSDLSDFTDIAGPALKRAGIKLVDFPMASRLFTASDNASLARKGVIAHSISAGSLHDDYHQPSDEVSKIDIEHMADVIEGIYSMGVEFAARSETPKWNEKGRRRLRLKPADGK